jgi:hypothetical protein
MTNELLLTDTLDSLTPVRDFIIESRLNRRDISGPNYALYLLGQGVERARAAAHVNRLIKDYGSIKKAFAAAGYVEPSPPHPLFSSLRVKSGPLRTRPFTPLEPAPPKPIIVPKPAPELAPAPPPVVEERQSSILSDGVQKQHRKWMRVFERECAANGLVPSKTHYGRWSCARRLAGDWGIPDEKEVMQGLSWEAACRKYFKNPDRFKTFGARRSCIKASSHSGPEL